MYGFYDKVLHKIGKDKGTNTVYVNIGAMDGIMFDDSAGYVATYGYLPLYVEPIPYLFTKLKNNITDIRAKFENAAISEYDGIIQMLTIDQTVIDKQLVHECFYGMSAIYPPRNGLASEGDRPIVEQYGKLVVVPCITLETLFTKHAITELDILSIDAEGHDWKILKQLDLKKYTPSVIRAEYINLNQEEQQELCKFLSSNNYVFEISGQNIDAIPIKLYNELFNEGIQNSDVKNSSITMVTGLWNMGREKLSDAFKRSYEEYKQKFVELLKTPVNMIIYVDESDVDFIWQHRSSSNTSIKVMNLGEFKTWFEYYDIVQNIRSNSEWRNQASWLTESPQANLADYNPIVMSKMFLLNNATLYNPFNSEYFYWIDAGITNTVHPGYFTHDKVFDNLPEYTDHINSFLFLSYPYEDGTEIHGFPRKELVPYCGVDAKYVCRGGFFGGTKSQINNINGLYYNVLANTLNSKLMGTEESLFTILAHRYTDVIHRFELGSDGLVWPFFEKLKNVTQLISETSKTLNYNTAKNILYVLGFNSPSQFESIVKSIETTDVDMFVNSRRILINNSTDEELFSEYDRLCKLYAFEEIHRENLGVCGGRQFAAEHFDKSDADFYMFFEDDMYLNGVDKINETCKCGLTKYVPNIYNKVLSIMIKEKFDFLKFSFSEFYGDNSIQWAWYNVPQSIRTEYWPHYDTLPNIGLDPNAPRTVFKDINVVEGTSYITGEIYYSNWPQIVSREGNKKMFLDTKWERPYEQTWMSHMFQLTKNNQLQGAVLLASPITHDRFDHYDGSLRKES